MGVKSHEDPSQEDLGQSPSQTCQIWEEAHTERSCAGRKGLHLERRRRVARDRRRRDAKTVRQGGAMTMWLRVARASPSHEVPGRAPGTGLKLLGVSAWSLGPARSGEWPVPVPPPLVVRCWRHSQLLRLLLTGVSRSGEQEMEKVLGQVAVLLGAHAFTAVR